MTTKPELWITAADLHQYIDRLTLCGMAAYWVDDKGLARPVLDAVSLNTSTVFLYCERHYVPELIPVAVSSDTVLLVDAYEDSANFPISWMTSTNYVKAALMLDRDINMSRFVTAAYDRQSGEISFRQYLPIGLTIEEARRVVDLLTDAIQVAQDMLKAYGKKQGGLA